MNIAQSKPLRIGIIGAGFSGTALAATLNKLTNTPLEIILLEKTDSFGTGHAYSTPFDFHLLNVRAQDMSAFDDDQTHFVNWLKTQSISKLDPNIPIGDQFVSRYLYGEYLKHLIQNLKADTKITLSLLHAEVMQIKHHEQQAILVLNNGEHIFVDKVILALGNSAPRKFPFPVSDVKIIHNPWDYLAPKEIPSDDPVLIVGTGLSMIDTVLTLHYQKHKGPIYAVSRHGLQPLPHADSKVPFFLIKEELPNKLRSLTRYLRTKSQLHANSGGDWRSVINALRAFIPAIWAKASANDKKQFLRHILPYWNVHRHRVHNKVADVLASMCQTKQLTILSGRIIKIQNSIATIQQRHSHREMNVTVKWVINCMGPALNMSALQNSLINSILKNGLGSLDSLGIGFNVDASGALIDAAGQSSSLLFTLGPPAKSRHWESSAVPEIRKQSHILAQTLLQKFSEIKDQSWNQHA